MHPEFNSQGSEPFELRKELDDRHMIPNPAVASSGFNIWWQKTAAQNMEMVTEASDLMRAHRLVNAACQPSARRAH